MKKHYHFVTVAIFVLFLTGILFSYSHSSVVNILGDIARNRNVDANTSGSISGKVVKVKDGDTVVIQPEGGGQFFVCRLYGIDAPEIAKSGKPGQLYGKEATDALKKLVLGKDVTVITTGARTYNREVCVIYHKDQNINLEMVRWGYAWAYRQYLKRPYASEYIGAETEARSKRLGLWHDTNPTPPWEFRKKTR
ncbi:MAG: thermonuclease family protein [Thermodesulfovibrionales bacterium]